MISMTTGGSDRLTRLFELHHDRLVRTVRARLGRYDWHLAEDIAAGTWLRAVEKVDQLRADDKRAFGWLATLAWSVQVNHFRALRNTERATDFTTGTAAYRLPKEWAAEDHALARLTLLIRLTDNEQQVEAVAA
jgi:DNA-directed RNA polymerase specialized sigma24 family protein